MASLVRSSTSVRLPRKRDDSKSSPNTPRGIRLRSSSFTNTTTTSNSLLSPNPTSQQQQQKQKRPPQAPGRPLPPPPPSLNYESAGQTQVTNHANATTGSLLTVNAEPSVASSVDTFSDDDDDDEEEEDDDDDDDNDDCPSTSSSSSPPPPLPPKNTSTFASYTQRQPSPSALQAPAPVPKASVSRSISNAFKDKLTLSRKKSVFSLRGKHHHNNNNSSQQRRHSNTSSPVLYDDGSQATYPPAPQKNKHNESTERDQYGFIKGSQWVSVEEQDTFEISYQPIVNRRLQKWRRLIAENDGEWPQPSSKFKRFIRKGIPPDLRGQAWLHYSGAEAKKYANPGVYRGYVERAEAMGLENEFLDIIERDLHRTFPDNVRFKSIPSTNKGKGGESGSISSSSGSSSSNSNNEHGRTRENSNNDVPAIQSLRRILSAFSLYAPDIGYCQSLNYIAGLLLLFMDEEDAFWTFVVLIQDILPPNIYDVTMEGANIDQTVLMMLLSERIPHVWNRMGSGKSFWECEEADGNNGMPTTTLVTSHWFLTLFINILPIESVLRVWDCLFYEGQRALFRVALAIFKMNEREVLAVNDPLEIFQVIQNMPKRMIDCHRLMESVYDKYASTTRVNEQDLCKRRELVKNRRDERRKNTPRLKRRLKRGTVRGTIIHKAMEARRLVERAKTVRR